jgi:peptidoglycan/LPS O-acetylase OafA/YrhL
MSSFALVLYMAGYGGASKAGKLAVYKVAASFLLLPQLSDALVNVTWTLKYEVFFYLIFSSLIINLRFGIVLLLTWQLLTLALSSFYSIHQLGVLGFYFTSLSLEFSIGIACTYALGFVGMQEWVQKQTILWPICFVGAAMFLLGMSTENRGGGVVGGNDAFTNHAWSIDVPCALGAGLLIFSLVLLERSGKLYLPKALIILGSASYSIYIVHYSVVTLLEGIAARYHVGLNGVICLVVAVLAVIIGSAFHYFVDQPIQGFLRTSIKPFIFPQQQVIPKGEAYPPTHVTTAPPRHRGRREGG